MKLSYQDRFIGYFVSYEAPNKLFGEQSNRKNWDHEQKKAWFSKFWDMNLIRAVEESESITAEMAKEQLELTIQDPRWPYFKDDMQHRLTRFKDMTFVVQLHQSSENLQVNQIWFVKSQDYNPLKICVTFPSHESKKRFISLSGNSDKYGNKLLAQIVKDYMQEHGQSWN